ncbi:MAG: translation initiation factor IF-2 subunit beta [archaeon]
MEYKELLERARSNLPESVLQTARFEVPKVRGHIQGNRTIISNFYAIAGDLRRTPEHLLKFILKEIAAPGDMKKSAVIIGRKVSASMINSKIGLYVDQFVICSVCRRPDTKLERKGNVASMVCQACGAHQPVKGKI